MIGDPGIITSCDAGRPGNFLDARERLDSIRPIWRNRPWATATAQPAPGVDGAGAAVAPARYAESADVLPGQILPRLPLPLTWRQIDAAFARKLAPTDRRRGYRKRPRERVGPGFAEGRGRREPRCGRHKWRARRGSTLFAVVGSAASVVNVRITDPSLTLSPILTFSSATTPPTAADLH